MRILVVSMILALGLSLFLMLLVASSAAGQTVGLEFQVNTHTTDDQKAPDVAKDALGNFIVVWESTGQDGDGRGVFGQRYDSAGVEMAGEFQVNSYTTEDQDQPSVAIGSDSFLVVWRSQGQDSVYSEIRAQLYDTGGMGLSSEFRVNSWVLCRVRHKTHYAESSVMRSNAERFFQIGTCRDYARHNRRWPKLE